jgi:AcrR family transcriptional regulator
VRDELERCAFELFERHGYESVTVEAIAEAADVSRTTFFRYYPNKEDVLVQWMRQVGDEAAQALLERPAAESPLVATREALMTLAEVYGQDSPRTELVERLRHTSPAVRTAYRDKVAYWEEASAQRSRRGPDAIRHDLQPRLLARLAMAAVTSANDTWAARQHEEPWSTCSRRRSPRSGTDHQVRRSRTGQDHPRLRRQRPRAGGRRGSPSQTNLRRPGRRSPRSVEVDPGAAQDPQPDDLVDDDRDDGAGDEHREPVGDATASASSTGPPRACSSVPVRGRATAAPG